MNNSVDQALRGSESRDATRAALSMLAKSTENLEPSVAVATGATIDRLLVSGARKVLFQADKMSKWLVAEIALIIVSIAGSFDRPLFNRIGDPAIRAGDELLGVLLCRITLYILVCESRRACARF